MKKYFPKLIVIFASLLPMFAFAAATTFRDLTSTVIVPIIKGIIRIFYVSLAIGLSYGVVMYFINSDNEKKREEIKGYLLWGVIGITVAFGLWGIVAILSATLGWGNVGIPFIQPPAP